MDFTARAEKLIPIHPKIRVFPLIAGSKLPAIKNFPVEATRDMNKIHRWNRRFPDANIGISTDDFVVIDIDNKGSKKGSDEIFRLELEGKTLPDTLEQHTPTGGEHLFYDTDEPISNGVNKLAPGIDFRGKGGYVVGAGSELENGTYTVVTRPIAPVPDWVRAVCRQARERPQAAAQTLSGIDPERAAHRARELLVRAQPAVEGQGGDAHTFKTICQVKDCGVDAATAFEILQDWNDKCVPPWSLDALAHKVENAYRYGLEPVGSKAAEAQFTVIEGAKVEPIRRSRLTLELFQDIEIDNKTTSLVQNFLDHGAMSVIYGESNSGKTFFALDMALHIALKREWQGRKIEGGGVIYVAAEGGRRIKDRLVAFRKAHSLAGQKVPFYLARGSIDLLTPNSDTKLLVEEIKAATERLQVPIRLIVVDTLARAIAGGNENAFEDMSAFVGNVDRIRSATDAHVAIVHHTGKDRAKGARGHSSLRAATDTEIEIGDYTDGGVPGIKVATVTKQRDHESGHEIGFSLEPVELGQGPYGEPIRSCVVRPKDLKTIRDFGGGEPLPDTWAAKALLSLKDALKHSTIPVPEILKLVADHVTTRDRWREKFVEQHGVEAKKTNYTRFDRAVRELQARGCVFEQREYVWA
jgi:hypothetical protein